MAVTLVPEAVTQPIGELSNHFFPQGDLTTQVEGWIVAAQEKVEADTSIDEADHNRAAAAWVYYRAYDYIANQLRSLPNSVSEGSGAISVAYTATQFRDYERKALAKLVEFNGLRSGNSSIGSHFTLAHGRRGL